SSRTSPLTVCFTIESTTVLPKPRRFGCDTGGPLLSVQLIAKISPSSRQSTSTRPAPTDSAPYLPALVASSGSARPQACRRAVHRDPGPHEIGKKGELGSRQILDINSLPLVPDQQVLIGRKRLDAVSEALDKIFRLTSRGLAGDCLHETKHVL